MVAKGFAKQAINGLIFAYIFFLFFNGMSYAAEEKESYNGEMRFIFKGLPTFYDFPDYDSYSVPESPKTLAGDIAWTSHEKAWNVRTRLREGLKEGPNYAGKYAVIMHGCGSSCQVYWIVNVETGKVVGNVTAGAGASYKIDSRLFIVNPPSDPLNIGGEYGFSATEHPIDFYLIGDDEQFKLIKRLDIGKMVPNVEAIQKGH
jgi:hypothetical protein